jgi:hypothetical protein
MSNAVGVKRVGGGVLAGVAPRGWVVGVAAVLCVLVCVAFWPAFSAGYVSWDDGQNFIANDKWHGLSGENVWWMLTTFHLGHYMPLTWVSFGLQYELFGEGPGPGHAVNIAVHAVNAMLFFFVTRWVLGLVLAGEREGGYSRLVTVASAVGAASFAVHPLRVECVAWITERRDVLSASLLLGALLAYGRAVVVGGSGMRSWRWYAGAVVLLFLSCASKAWGMSFFVVLMALDVYPLRRVDGIRGWFTRAGMWVALEKLPFAVIGFVTAAVASAAQDASIARKTLEEWGVMERVVQSFYGLTFYLKQTVAPSTHSPFYELPVEVRPFEPEYLAAYFVVTSLVVFTLWCWRKAPGVGIGLFIYLVQVSPVLGVLQSGHQMVADRYSYLATMPFAVGLAWALVWMVRTSEARAGLEGGLRAARMGGVVMCGAVGALTAASYAQSTIWHSGKRLWEYATSVTPTASVLTNYAAEFEKSKDVDRAMELYRQAFEANPSQGRAWYSYANLAWAKGDLAEAERAFLEGAKVMPQAYMAHQNLASIYLSKGLEEPAIAQLRLAIANIEDPKQRIWDGLPYVQLAEVLDSRGAREEAVALLRKAMAFEKTRELAVTRLKEMGVEVSSDAGPVNRNGR